MLCLRKEWICAIDLILDFTGRNLGSSIATPRLNLIPGNLFSVLSSLVAS